MAICRAILGSIHSSEIKSMMPTLTLYALCFGIWLHVGWTYRWTHRRQTILRLML